MHRGLALAPAPLLLGQPFEVAPRGREVTLRELELGEHREHALAHQAVACAHGVVERLPRVDARLLLASELRAGVHPSVRAVRLAPRVADLRADLLHLDADALDGRE